MLCRAFFAELNDRDYSQPPTGCSSVGPFGSLGLFGMLSREADMYSYLLLGLSEMVMKGCDFGQAGGNDGQREGIT